MSLNLDGTAVSTLGGHRHPTGKKGQLSSPQAGHSQFYHFYVHMSGGVGILSRENLSDMHDLTSVLASRGEFSMKLTVVETVCDSW